MVVVIFFIVYPWVKEIVSMRADMVKERALLEQKLIPKEKALQSLNEEDLDKMILQLEEALPSFPYEVTALSVLESIAVASGVNLGGLNAAVAGTGSVAGVDAVVVPLLADADRSHLVAFLKNLDRAKRVLALEQISLETDGAVLHMTAQALAPYCEVPGELGRVEDPLPQLTAADEEVLNKVSQLNLYGVSLSREGQQVPAGKENPF